MLSPPKNNPETNQQLTLVTTGARPDDLPEADTVALEQSQRPANEGSLPFLNVQPSTVLPVANKALIQQAYDEVLNNSDYSILKELFALNFQHHEPGLPIFALGANQAKFPHSVYRLAVSDMHYTIEEIIAEEDHVVTRWRVHGRHTGHFGLQEPTGEQIAWSGVTIWRIANNQIIEAWTIQKEPEFAGLIPFEHFD